MELKEFEQLVGTARARQDLLLTTKGADYTRKEADRLSNFKRVAVAIGIPINKVWSVYAHKHWDALMTFISTGKVESEGLIGRLDDLHNYLYLLEALLVEQETGRAGGPTGGVETQSDTEAWNAARWPPAKPAFGIPQEQRDFQEKMRAFYKSDSTEEECD